MAWLAANGLKGRMTGSGSAVFAYLPQGTDFRAVSPGAGWQVRSCSNLEAHPLAGWAS
jgi:4-diphosphocytidyl-2-C-methyl-D-erythritol kinase